MWDHGRVAVEEKTILTEIILSPLGLIGERPTNLLLKRISQKFFLGIRDYLGQDAQITFKYLLNQVRRTYLATRLKTTNRTICRQVIIRIQIGVSRRVTVRREVWLFLCQLRLAGLDRLNLSTIGIDYRCLIKESGQATGLVGDADLANQPPLTGSSKMEGLEEVQKDILPLMTNLLIILEGVVKLNGNRISLLCRGRQRPIRELLITRP